jgi:hypothetical protein
MWASPLEARLVLVVAVEEAFDRERHLGLMCPRICEICKIWPNVVAIFGKKWGQRRYRRRLSPDFENVEIEVVI